MMVLPLGWVMALRRVVVYRVINGFTSNLMSRCDRMV